MVLQALRSDSEKHFTHIRTGDESWFHHSYELPVMFGHGRDKVIPRISQTIGPRKTMTNMSFTGTRLPILVHLPQGQKCNKESLIEQILEEMNAERNHGRVCRITKINKIHLDNSRVHNAPETAEKMREMKMDKLPIHFIHLISAHMTSSFLDRPRRRGEIGDLLIRIMLSRGEQSHLTMSFLMCFSASSRAAFGGWSG
jgi:hypothetical protein